MQLTHISLSSSPSLALLQVVARSRGGVATIAMPAVVRTVRPYPLSTRRTAYAVPPATPACGLGLAEVVAPRLDPIRFARPLHRQLRIIIHTWTMRTVPWESVRHSMRNWIANRCAAQIRRIRTRRTVSAARWVQQRKDLEGVFLTALYSTEIQFPGARAGHSHGRLVGAEQRLLLGFVGDGNAWRRQWQQSGRLRDSWT